MNACCILQSFIKLNLKWRSFQWIYFFGNFNKKLIIVTDLNKHKHKNVILLFIVSTVLKFTKKLKNIGVLKNVVLLSDVYSSLSTPCLRLLFTVIHHIGHPSMNILEPKTLLFWSWYFTGNTFLRRLENCRSSFAEHISHHTDNGYATSNGSMIFERWIGRDA